MNTKQRTYRVAVELERDVGGERKKLLVGKSDKARNLQLVSITTISEAA
jgi:hypothetical protein